MANNRGAFERLLFSIKKHEFGQDFDPEKLMESHYTIGTFYKSEIFLGSLLYKRAIRVSTDYQDLENMIIKIKSIAKKLDLILDSENKPVKPAEL